jgi:hypothetical protein
MSIPPRPTRTPSTQPLIRRESSDGGGGAIPPRPTRSSVNVVGSAGSRASAGGLPPPPTRKSTDVLRLNTTRSTEMIPNPSLSGIEEAVSEIDGEDRGESIGGTGGSSTRNISTSQGSTIYKIAEDIDLEAGDENDASNLPNKKGFTRTVCARLEVPREALDRLLLNDEKVCGDFDCYYPDWKTYSFSTHLNTCQKTMGLYLIFLLFVWIKECIQYCLGLESVSMNRGKMIVTDKGRLIFWQTKAVQSRWFGLDGRAYFKAGQAIRIMNIRDVRETILLYKEAKAFGCCCNDSKVSLEVVFNSFNDDRSEYSDFFNTNPSGPFYEEVSRNTTIPNYGKGWFQRGSVASKAPDTSSTSESVTGQPLMVRLVSKDGDECVTSNHHGMEALERILELQAQLSKHLELRDSFITDPKIVPAYKDHDELYNFELVDTNGDVTIPMKYLNLTPGEDVISSIGQRHVTSCNEWVLSLITLGIYYCLVLKNKKNQRTAHILTNKRIVEIHIDAENGKVPFDLRKMKASVRSVFPGRILSGLISYQADAITHSALLTESGEIHLYLPVHSRSAVFAHAMQSVSSRMKTKLKVRADEDGIRPSERPTTTRNTATIRERWGLTPEKVAGHIDTLDLDSLEVIPLVPGEKVVHWVPSAAMGDVKKDGGSLAISNRSIIRLHRAPEMRAQPKDKVGMDVIANQGGSDLVNTGSIWRDSFFLMWIPVCDVIGSSTEIVSEGRHPENFMCSLCECNAPTIIADKYSYAFLTNRGIRLAIHGSRDGDSHGSWVRDEDLRSLQKVGGIVQTNNQDADIRQDKYEDSMV